MLSIPETTPDAWARANRTYPLSAGRPGPRDPSLTPYMIPFMRSAASRTYRKVVMCVAVQSGKTDAALDIIGQRIAQRPVPILYVGPTKQFLNEQFEPRLMMLLDEAPSLAYKVARGKRMTKTRKMINGVPLRLAHGGSTTALKSDPAGLAVTDEVDELKKNLKGQGDPTGLIDSRGDTYADFVHVIVSTPSRGIKETVQDEKSGLFFWKVQDQPGDVRSSIWKFWQAGTRRHWTWRCPHCSKRFIPRFDLFIFDGKEGESLTTPARARQTAAVSCPVCGVLIGDEHKDEMNATGLYVAPGQWVNDLDEVEGAPPSSNIDSYWASGLCSPFMSFGDRAEAYAEAKLSGDQEKIQTVINNGFGECWEPDYGDAPDWHTVRENILPYRFGEVPTGVLFLTAGVDVQKRKLVYVVRGWGLRQESWLIEHGEIFGDTRLDQTWIDLYEQVIDREYAGLRPIRVFVDSGFRPDDPASGDVHKVYEFCRRHKGLCFATKGRETQTTPIVVHKHDVNSSGGRLKFSVKLVFLDSTYMKDWVHSRVTWPKEAKGGWHLPTDTTEDYCRQIGNESKMLKPDGGFQWVRRGSNDFLDAESMAYAAAKMLGMERLTETSSERRVEVSSPSPPAMEKPAAAPPPTAAPRSAQTGDGGGWIGQREGWFRR